MIDETKLNKIYDDYCENSNELAAEEVQSTYRKLNTALENYIAAVVEDTFKKGFCYALRLAKGGAIE